LFRGLRASVFNIGTASVLPYGSADIDAQSGGRIFVRVCQNGDMVLEVRPCSPGDVEALYEVWSLTYNNGEPMEPGKGFRHCDHFVGVSEGKVVGAFGVMPMTATRGRASLKSAGVLAVAVAPDQRRKGIGQAMMRYALRHCRASGCELSGLYAFRESFYRRFGYEVAGTRYRISVDFAAFPNVCASLPVRRLGMGDVEAIRSCYETFAHQRSGLNLRPHQQWERVVNPETTRTLYVAGDPAEAYAVVQHKVDFWTEQHVIELVWSSRRGYDTILSVLAGIGINKSKLTWVEPSDSPFRALYWDHGAEVTAVSPQIMFRVLDVPGSLRALKPSSSGSFTVEVMDDELPENRGPWRVAFSPNGVEVDACASAGLVLDVRRFAQALLGEPSLATLVMNDLVQVGCESDAAAAQSLLPASPTLCLEYF
jgi:predicted acetyltransferase